MMQVAHVAIDDTAAIVEVDDAFCTLMRCSADRLVGTYMLAITAPADRERCFRLFGALRQTGEPFVTVKRLIRADGTHLWTTNRAVKETGADGTPRYLFSVEPTEVPADVGQPGELLLVARMIRLARRRRGAAFGAQLFADHSWDVLLSAYIAEAEGTLLTIADLHVEIGLSLANATRWVRALVASGFVEFEGEDGKLVTAPIRLNALGHQRFEEYLSGLVDVMRAPAAFTA